MGSVRRECLGHVLVLSARHLQQLLKHYGAYFNRSPRHHGLDQQVPVPTPARRYTAGSRVVATPVLARLHHEYSVAA
jgi:hypothetical protein